jgi:hypothetical protein
MHPGQLAVSPETVRELVDAQFPQWRALAIKPLPASVAGTDLAAQCDRHGGRPGRIRAFAHHLAEFISGVRGISTGGRTFRGSAGGDVMSHGDPIPATCSCPAGGWPRSSMSAAWDRLTPHWTWSRPGICSRLARGRRSATTRWCPARAGVPIRRHGDFSGTGHFDLPALPCLAMRGLPCRTGALDRLALITQVPRSLQHRRPGSTFSRPAG